MFGGWRRSMAGLSAALALMKSPVCARSRAGAGPGSAASRLLPGPRVCVGKTPGDTKQPLCLRRGRPRAARGERPGAHLQPGPAQCASAPLGSRRRLPPRRARDPRRPPCLLCSGRWAEGVRNLGSGSPDRPSPAAAPEEAGPIPTRGADQRALHGPGGDRPGHVLAEGGPGVVGWRSVTQG